MRMHLYVCADCNAVRAFALPSDDYRCTAVRETNEQDAYFYVCEGPLVKFDPADPAPRSTPSPYDSGFRKR